MDAVRRLEIEGECKRLVSEFFYCADRGDFTAVAELFDMNGEFDRFGSVLRGRSEIANAMENRPPGVISRHAILNLRFVAVGEDVVSANVDASALFGFAAEGVPTVTQSADSPRIVQFDDSYRNVDGEWKIERRVGQLVMAGHERP